MAKSFYYGVILSASLRASPRPLSQPPSFIVPHEGGTPKMSTALADSTSSAYEPAGVEWSFANSKSIGAE